MDDVFNNISQEIKSSLYDIPWAVDKTWKNGIKILKEVRPLKPIFNLDSGESYG
jgi:hypothetical protein